MVTMNVNYFIQTSNVFACFLAVMSYTEHIVHNNNIQYMIKLYVQTIYELIGYNLAYTFIAEK